MKTCRMCHRELELECFPLYRGSNDGHATVCTHCDPFRGGGYRTFKKNYRNWMNERGVCTGSWRANGNKMAIS